MAERLHGCTQIVSADFRPQAVVYESRGSGQRVLPVGATGICQWLTNVVHLLVRPQQSKAALCFSTIQVKWRQVAVQQNRLCVLLKCGKLSACVLRIFRCSQ